MSEVAEREGLKPAELLRKRYIGSAVSLIAGAALGIFTALLMSNLVARPIDELKSAARDVAEGRLDRSHGQCGCRPSRKIHSSPRRKSIC